MIEWFKANIGFLASLATVATALFGAMIVILRFMHRKAMSDLKESLAPMFNAHDARIDYLERQHERLDERIHLVQEDGKKLWSQLSAMSNRIEQIYQILLRKEA